jgi:hypothetical protein
MAGRMESDSWHDKSIHEYLVVGSDGDAEWLGGLWVWWCVKVRDGCGFVCLCLGGRYRKYRSITSPASRDNTEKYCMRYLCMGGS